MPNYARRVLEERLWAVDIETGGIEVGCPVLEVAYGPVFSDELYVLWNKDAREEDCERSALAINHCFDDDRPHAPKEKRCSELVMARVIALELNGRVLVGSNPQFDSGHLEHLLDSRRLKRTWSYRLIDLKSLVVGWAAAQGILEDMPERGWSQNDVAKYVGIPDIPAELQHTAAGDVEQLRQIVRRVLG